MNVLLEFHMCCGIPCCPSFKMCFLSFFLLLFSSEKKSTSFSWIFRERSMPFVPLDLRNLPWSDRERLLNMLKQFTAAKQQMCEHVRQRILHGGGNLHPLFAHLYAVCIPNELHRMCERITVAKWRVSGNMCRRVSKWMKWRFLCFDFSKWSLLVIRKFRASPWWIFNGIQHFPCPWDEFVHRNKWRTMMTTCFNFTMSISLKIYSSLIGN